MWKSLYYTIAMKTNSQTAIKVLHSVKKLFATSDIATEQSKQNSIGTRTNKSQGQ